MTDIEFLQKVGCEHHSDGPWSHPELPGLDINAENGYILIGIGCFEYTILKVRGMEENFKMILDLWKLNKV